MVSTIYAVRLHTSEDWFVEYPLPLRETDRLFDVGIVDANGDDLLDIYTSNHHFRQVLLIADGRGGYRDMLSEWGLDQSLEFPMAELSFAAPRTDKAGAYLYWLGTNLVIIAHRTSEVGRWSGVLHTFDPVEIVMNRGFHVEKHADRGSVVTETTLEFAPESDGKLVLRPGGQGLPEEFRFTGAIRPSQVFVGRGRVSPSEPTFSVTMQDRHALAWADYNDDGVLDIFITRGALAGTLRAHTEDVRRGIKDELLVSQGQGKFADMTIETGIEKKGCSGRHTRWLDFDGDGLLDLFVNCYDRENVQGDYPKQLWRRQADKRFTDVAAQVGLGLPEQQIGGFAWIDVDNDGDVDLVGFQDEGFFLYRNHGSRFVQEQILRRAASGIDRIGHTAGNYWFFDGKLTVADFDADGDLDVFSASKRGNVLLINAEGKFQPIKPASIGLPQESVTAQWVDYDNDGLPDLHAVPQGLFRQHIDHTFKATKLLALSSEQYQAAICNWLDLDNDGRQDVLMALNEDPSFKRWWQLGAVPKRGQHWVVRTYRNIGPANHWLQVVLTGAPGNPQGIGARVTVVTPEGRQVQEVGASEGSFFSQGHYRLYFGLGSHAVAESVEVRWPDGYSQTLKQVVGDRLLDVERKTSLHASRGRSQ
jgi:hypothetical protein